MSVLGRKPSWQTQLRQTKAKEWLFAGRVDNFPLTELQKIATWLLRDKSPLLSRRGIPPQSQECDVLFANELATVRGELGIHESAIIGCLHLLSYHQARGQILSIKPDPSDGDLFFERRLDAYLQCIILSRRASPGVCSEEEGVAAEELLGVLKGRSKDFPSILGLLKVVGNEKCEDLLPVPLVKKVLKQSHYQANLTREMDSLRRSHRWFDAYKLVCGLRDVIGLPRADRMLRDMFPDYPMWAAWRPDSRRILSWESPNLVLYREHLGPVLDLEGPDTTGQQRGTLRMSSPGAFAGLSEPAYSHGRYILDHLLETLDSCLTVGLSTIDLLIALCIENNDLSQLSLNQLEAAIQVSDDAASGILASLIRSLAPDATLTTKMTVFTNAIPLLTTHPTLQRHFAFSIGLPQLVLATLVSAQRYFCHCLTSSQDIDIFGRMIIRFSHALGSATWLHPYWETTYLNMLRHFPTEQEAQISFRAVSLHRPASPSVAGHVEFLATRIGGTATIPPNPHAMELPGSRPLHPASWGADLIHRPQRTSFTYDSAATGNFASTLVELES